MLGPFQCSSRKSESDAVKWVGICVKELRILQLAVLLTAPLRTFAPTDCDYRIGKNLFLVRGPTPSNIACALMWTEAFGMVDPGHVGIHGT